MIEDIKFVAIGEGNGKLKQIRGVISNSKPNPNKLFVCEGIKMHHDLKNHNAKIESLIVCKNIIKTEEAWLVIEYLASRAENVFEVSEKTMQKLSEKDSPEGIMSLVYLPRYNVENLKLKDNALIVVTDGIEIPGNVGTLIRMCDGAGVDALFVCNRKARLTHPKVIRASQGSLLTLPIIEFDDTQDCIDFLNKNKVNVYLADSRAEKEYHKVDYSGKTAFVLGSERYGITKQWYNEKHFKVSIPMLGDCDSLNVAVAGTVLVYQASQQLKF